MYAIISKNDFPVISVYDEIKCHISFISSSTRSLGILVNRETTSNEYSIKPFGRTMPSLNDTNSYEFFIVKGDVGFTIEWTL